MWFFCFFTVRSRIYPFFALLQTFVVKNQGEKAKLYGPRRARIEPYQVDEDEDEEEEEEEENADLDNKEEDEEN